MSDADRCQFCGQPGDWCVCGEPLLPLAAGGRPFNETDMPLEPPAGNAYPDCAMPDNCECRRRGYPAFEHTMCLLPAINFAALEIGWLPPYPGDEIAGASDSIARGLLADLKAGKIDRIGGETVEKACDERMPLTGDDREYFVIRTLRRLVSLV